MSLGSDSPGGSPEGIGGNESGIGGGGMGGQGGYGGLGIGNPSSYGGQTLGASGMPEATGFYGGPVTGPDADDFAAQNMSLGMAMAQSDIQAMQNNMERGLASNPSLSTGQVGNSMMDFTGLSGPQQQNQYGMQASMDLSRDLSTRSLSDQWSARQAAKAMGSDMSPYNEGLGATAAKGVIDFAAGRLPMGLGKAFSAVTGRSPGEMGLDMGYADLSQQVARGETDPQSAYGSDPGLGLGISGGDRLDRGTEQKLVSLIERMNRPSAIVRGV